MAALVFVAALGAAVLPGQPAWATAPVTGSGTFADVGFAGGPIRVADGNTFFEVTITSEYQGAVVGTRVINTTVVFHRDGSFNARGIGTCDCTIGGHSGTWVDRFSVTGIAGQSVTGSFAVVSGSGGLSNLHAVATVSGQPNPSTGLNMGSYSIAYHFES